MRFWNLETAIRHKVNLFFFALEAWLLKYPSLFSNEAIV